MGFSKVFYQKSGMFCVSYMCLVYSVDRYGYNCAHLCVCVRDTCIHMFGTKTRIYTEIHQLNVHPRRQEPGMKLNAITI